jgi:hypothetical protein
MGNETSNSSASTPSPGVSSSFSFLARRRASQKSQIVVVNSSTQPVGDPNDDVDLKKLKEIPRFFPILKGCLAGQRDSPDILTKIDPRYVNRFLSRLQHHFVICSQAVAQEQTALYTRITETDHEVTALTKKFNQSSKKFEVLSNELKKIDSLTTQLAHIEVQLKEIVPQLIVLNDILPETERLPPLQL